MRALEPRLAEIVLAGGWAWYVYRKYLTGERSLPGEFTLDVDLVVPRRLSSTEPRLDEMLAAADFELEMEGEERPPVSKYSWPSTEASEAVVEFLTPARASGDAATLEINGVVAQQLRFLDLLLDDPVSIQVDERAEDERFAGSLRVPNIGLFVLQKVLTFRRLPWKAKRGPDWTRQAARLLEENCGSPEADAIGRVLNQIPEEQRPSRRYVSDTFGELIRVLRSGAD